MNFQSDETHFADSNLMNGAAIFQEDELIVQVPMTKEGTWSGKSGSLARLFLNLNYTWLLFRLELNVLKWKYAS